MKLMQQYFELNVLAMRTGEVAYTWYHSVIFPWYVE